MVVVVPVATTVTIIDIIIIVMAGVVLRTNVRATIRDVKDHIIIFTVSATASQLVNGNHTSSCSRIGLGNGVSFPCLTTLTDIGKIRNLSNEQKRRA
jgi:hypothetical protein